MKTEHILVLPHNVFDIEKEITDNLRVKDYVNYGYIKLRDLNKWLNNEVVSVKMGMLTPSNKSYRGLTIIQSVLKRIKEQDTTALFDDEDELVPVYVFVSEETDNEWRNYLTTKGFVNSRKNANREGIKIDKYNLSFQYGVHYNIETIETKTEQEKRETEIKTTYERNKKHFEITLGYGENTYDVYKEKQEKRCEQLNKSCNTNSFIVNPKTLEIKGWYLKEVKERPNDWWWGVFAIVFLSIVYIIGMGVLWSLELPGIIFSIIAIPFLTLCALGIFNTYEVKYVETEKIEPPIKEKTEKIKKDDTPYFHIILLAILFIGTIIAII